MLSDIGAKIAQLAREFAQQSQGISIYSKVFRTKQSDKLCDETLAIAAHLVRERIQINVPERC